MNLSWTQAIWSKWMFLQIHVRRGWTVWLAAVSLGLVVTPVLAQGSGGRVLSKSDIVKMLDRSTPQARIKTLVLQRHIDFDVTEEVENDLKKNHGASDELIDALKGSQPRSQEPVTPDSESRSTEQPSHPEEGTPPNNSDSLKTRPSRSADSHQITLPTSNRATTILVRADLASLVAVDGNEIGKLQAGETTIRSVGIGQHLVEAKVPGLSLRWQKTVTIDQVGQVIVETELQPLLDAKISGNWHRDTSKVTNDGCQFGMDEWVLSVQRDKSLSDKYVRLERNAGIQYEDTAPRSCPVTPSSHCIRSFRLQLSLPDPASGLNFDSALDPSGRNVLVSPQSEEDENAKQFCERVYSLPTAGFTGTLVPVSESTIRLKIDSLNVDLVLTRL